MASPRIVLNGLFLGWTAVATVSTTAVAPAVSHVATTAVLPVAPTPVVTVAAAQIAQTAQTAPSGHTTPNARKSQKAQKPLPYLNPSLPLEVRVKDLISRMTLEEKVSEMVNTSAPIDRLHIPAYDWWSEALHGVARSGVATVFPLAWPPPLTIASCIR
jgi:hypothetical protein